MDKLREMFKPKMEIFEIFSITLSTDKSKRIALALVTANNELFAELRLYNNSRATKHGVYLREKEYNWFTKLVNGDVLDMRNPPVFESRYPGGTIGTNDLRVYKKGCRMDIVQLFRGETRSIRLFHKETDMLYNNFDTFDKIIDFKEKLVFKK